MADKILLRAGGRANIPKLDNREIGYVTDEKALYVGTPTGNVKVASAFTEDRMDALEDDMAGKLTAIQAAAVPTLAGDADAAAIAAAFNSLLASLKASGMMTSLPEGYTQLNYVETNGTQYFDTGLYPGGTTRVVMDVEATSEASPVCFFGARTSATSNNYAFVWTGSVMRSDYGSTYTQTWAVPIRQRRTIDKNGPTTTVDGVTYSYAEASFRAPQTMKLLAIDNNGKVQWNIAAKLYGCKVYGGTSIYRDFVPCINDANGFYGLYDKVQGKFYTPLGGSVTGG